MGQISVFGGQSQGGDSCDSHQSEVSFHEAPLRTISNLQSMGGEVELSGDNYFDLLSAES
jgi:hypothetical protein